MVFVVSRQRLRTLLVLSVSIGVLVVVWQSGANLRGQTVTEVDCGTFNAANIAIDGSCGNDSAQYRCTHESGDSTVTFSAVCADGLTCALFDDGSAKCRPACDEITCDPYDVSCAVRTCCQEDPNGNHQHFVNNNYVPPNCGGGGPGGGPGGGGVCGDGSVDSGEECDEGSNNVTSGPEDACWCSDQCRLAQCCNNIDDDGDGSVDLSDNGCKDIEISAPSTGSSGPSIGANLLAQVGGSNFDVGEFCSVAPDPVQCQQVANQMTINLFDRVGRDSEGGRGSCRTLFQPAFFPGCTPSAPPSCFPAPICPPGGINGCTFTTFRISHLTCQCEQVDIQLPGCSGGPGGSSPSPPASSPPSPPSPPGASPPAPSPAPSPSSPSPPSPSGCCSAPTQEMSIGRCASSGGSHDGNICSGTIDSVCCTLPASSSSLSSVTSSVLSSATLSSAFSSSLLSSSRTSVSLSSRTSSSLPRILGSPPPPPSGPGCSDPAICVRDADCVGVGTTKMGTCDFLGQPGGCCIYDCVAGDQCATEQQCLNLAGRRNIRVAGGSTMCGINSGLPMHCCTPGRRAASSSSALSATSRFSGASSLSPGGSSRSSTSTSSLNMCGNDVVDSGNGEECDDGFFNRDTAPTNCVGLSSIAYCPFCSTQCKNIECGDGNVDTGLEECDEGRANSNTPMARCRPKCVKSRCGDGIVDRPSKAEIVSANPPEPVDGIRYEECDDTTDNCFACQKVKCGDGRREKKEECDDGNTDNFDDCPNDCKLAVCQDGVVEGKEECDDGNAIDTDDCTNACTLTFCGDGVVQSGSRGEECDDGNTDNGDGCSDTCENEHGAGSSSSESSSSTSSSICAADETCVAPSNCRTPGSDPAVPCRAGGAKICCKACGDSIVNSVGPDGVPRTDDDEHCDEGPKNADKDKSACRTNCRLGECGDGIVDVREECDDGNTDDGDGCSRDCFNEICGDGVQTPNEECDYGTEHNSDDPLQSFCSTKCTLQMGSDDCRLTCAQCDLFAKVKRGLIGSIKVRPEFTCHSEDACFRFKPGRKKSKCGTSRIFQMDSAGIQGYCSECARSSKEIADCVAPLLANLKKSIESAPCMILGGSPSDPTAQCVPNTANPKCAVTSSSAPFLASASSTSAGGSGGSAGSAGSGGSAGSSTSSVGSAGSGGSSTSSVPGFCGDEIVQPELGEECEVQKTCMNFGEECDDHFECNRPSATCEDTFRTIAVCKDGSTTGNICKEKTTSLFPTIIQDCARGLCSVNKFNPFGTTKNCNPDCTLSVCGNGRRDPGENCFTCPADVQCASDLCCSVTSQSCIPLSEARDDDICPTHLACSAAGDGECVSVPGFGSDECDPEFAILDRCLRGTHLECVNRSCTVVDGVGPDSCGDDADCASRTLCDFVTNQCVLAPQSGPNECDLLLGCDPIVHSECVAGECASVPGPGANECSASLPCGLHLACEEEACVEVPGAAAPDGPFANECQPRFGCGVGTHLECDGLQCIEVNGSGPNECRNLDDGTTIGCGGHTQCIERQCQIVNGSGLNQCDNPGGACLLQRSKCENNACVIVEEFGRSECTRDAECAATHTECIAGRCFEVDGPGDAECRGDSDCGSLGAPPPPPSAAPAPVPVTAPPPSAIVASPPPPLAPPATTPVITFTAPSPVTAPSPAPVITVTAPSPVILAAPPVVLITAPPPSVIIASPPSPPITAPSPAPVITFTAPPPIIVPTPPISAPPTAPAPVARCGNFVLDPGEQCDQGSLNSNILPDRCRQNCSNPTCGDNVIDESEFCDDGNNLPQDGCSSNCQRERESQNVFRCGDGRVNQTFEHCDDGNTTSGDGCDARCRIEGLRGSGAGPGAGPTNSLEEIARRNLQRGITQCGDGKLDSGELCDGGPFNSNQPTALCTLGCQINFANPQAIEQLIPQRQAATQVAGQTFVLGQTSAEVQQAVRTLTQTLPPAQPLTISFPGGQQQTIVASQITQIPFTSLQNAHITIPTAQLQGIFGNQQPTTNNQQLLSQLQQLRSPARVSQPLPYVVQGSRVAGNTGPAALVVIAGGAATGIGFVRRRRKKVHPRS